MMIVFRWIAVATSFLAVCVSGYSLWLSGCQNRKLFYRNRDLMVENAGLRAKCDAYWEEIVELRERLYDGEEN
jgi:hypothetical protein